MRFFRTAPHDDEVEPAEASARQAKGAVLVDVREPGEWKRGHAVGAVHIPLGSLGERLSELPEGELLFVCQSGGRSSDATSLARSRGLDAKNVRGGMFAWSRAGLPIEKSA